MDDATAAKGAAIAASRRAAGLTEKELAQRLGISLWELDRLERAEVDPAPRLADVAKQTGLDPSEFDVTEPPPAPPRPSPEEPPGPEAEGRLDQGGVAVLGMVGILVTIRLFTETIGVLPRALNFIDIPLMLGLAGAAALSSKGRPPLDRFGVALLPLVGAFLCLCGVGILTNPSRIAIAPVLVFIYGVLSPFLIYRAVLQLWPAGNSLIASRVFVALGVLQLVVITGIDLPKFLADPNPDVISGTFGTNPYQFVFFGIIFVGLLGGIYSLEPGRLASRFAPAMIGLTLLFIVLAQYRALLVATGLALLFMTLVLSRGAGASRGRIVAGVTILGFVAALAFGTQRVPILKLNETFDADPAAVIDQRVDVLDRVVDLYRDEPRFLLTGTGPGTYSSRGWSTFALSDSESESNVQGGYAEKLTGGRIYRTDVSDRYVRPLLSLSNGEVVAGSRAATSPYAEYTSVAAEVGIFGLAILLGIYIPAFIAALGRLNFALRNPLPGDPLPALLLAAAIGLFVLLQMGLLENWLEVTRITFPTFALLAITAKEFASRRQPAD